MSQSIPLNTVLGERYKVTASVIETADGDAVLEGKDQVLNRKVSIVVAAPVHNQRLITNARALATGNRSSIQILDLGNADGRTYLITSHTRADTLLDKLLTDSSTLKANSEKEALGEEIFGDTGASTASNHYQKVSKPEVAAAAAPAAISATRALEEEPVAEPVVEPDYDEEYNDYEEEDEDEQKSGSPWILATAAVILLMIGAAAAYSSLNGMIDTDSMEASNQATPSASASATPSPVASQTATPTPSPTQTAKKVDPNFTGVSRIVPSNPTFMADQDATLRHMIDGNRDTQWMTYGFGSINFGGLVDSFALSFELEEETKVSELVINQISGTGGSFTVFANETNSLDGAAQVGSGSFTAAENRIALDEGKQSDDTKFIIVRFDSAPTLSQPIVNGFVFGARINEVTANN